MMFDTQSNTIRPAGRTARRRRGGRALQSVGLTVALISASMICSSAMRLSPDAMSLSADLRIALKKLKRKGLYEEARKSFFDKLAEKVGDITPTGVELLIAVKRKGRDQNQPATGLIDEMITMHRFNDLGDEKYKVTFKKCFRKLVSELEKYQQVLYHWCLEKEIASHCRNDVAVVGIICKDRRKEMFDEFLSRRFELNYNDTGSYFNADKKGYKRWLKEEIKKVKNTHCEWKSRYFEQVANNTGCKIADIVNLLMAEENNEQRRKLFTEYIVSGLKGGARNSEKTETFVLRKMSSWWHAICNLKVIGCVLLLSSVLWFISR